jgi:hypothetical protein
VDLFLFLFFLHAPFKARRENKTSPQQRAVSPMKKDDRATSIHGAAYSLSELRPLTGADRQDPFTPEELQLLAAIKNEFNATLVDPEQFDQLGVSTVQKCKMCGADYYYGAPESEYCSYDCLSQHVRQSAGDNPSKERRRHLKQQCRATWERALEKVDTSENFETWLSHFEKRIERMREASK